MQSTMMQSRTMWLVLIAACWVCADVAAHDGSHAAKAEPEKAAEQADAHKDHKDHKDHKGHAQKETAKAESAHVHGAHSHGAHDGKAEPVVFHPPEPYDLETVYKSANAACESKQMDCFEEQFHSITGKHGPAAAIETFTLLRERGDIPADSDGHHVVHHIGHHTAMMFGTTGAAFSLCPTSYNYGCLHGFFQYALDKGGSTSQAAATICEDVEKDPSLTSKHKFSCYHGLGHGVMMYESHDLLKSLKICDVLKTPSGQEGCWQGVFMENIVVMPKTDENFKKGLFSQEDPLAPCSLMDSKYWTQCFWNHSGRLMEFYQGDLAQASEACLKAPQAAVNTCLETLGFLTTNPGWQISLMMRSGTDTGSFLKNGWTLCQKFPKDHIRTCVMAGLDNLMNSNAINIAEAQEFCSLTGEFQTECSKRMGSNLLYLRADVKTAEQDCRVLKKEGLNECLTGLGIVTASIADPSP